MQIEYTVVATIDEEALREHVAKWGDQRYPIVDDPSEFMWSDLEAAVGEEIVTDPEVTGFTILSEPA